MASARSIPEFNLIEAITASSDLLLRFGGHAQAAGFTVRIEDIGKITGRLTAHAGERLSSLDLTPSLEIDAVASLPEMTEDVFQWLNVMEPFGKGNRRPVFASLGVSVKEPGWSAFTAASATANKSRLARESCARVQPGCELETIGGQAGKTRLDLPTR